MFGACQPATAEDRLALGPPNNWKYVAFDPGTRTVLVAHGTEVTVADTTLRMVGRVDGLSGVHGVAVVPGGRGYASTKSGNVAVFDTRRFTVTGTLQAGADANDVVYDPASRHVFVTNDDAGSVTVIDPAVDKVVSTIGLPGGEGLAAAAADGQGHLFVNHAARQEVVRIDTRRNLVEAAWKLAGCAKPEGLALDAVLKRLFISCDGGGLVVVDAGSGRQVAAVPVGRGNRSVLYDVRRRRIYVPVPASEVDVIDVAGADRFMLRPSLAAAAGTKTGALDQATGRLYLAGAGAGGMPFLQVLIPAP